jgi:hypothetical protein
VRLTFEADCLEMIMREFRYLLGLFTSRLKVLHSPLTDLPLSITLLPDSAGDSLGLGIMCLSLARAMQILGILAMIPHFTAEVCHGAECSLLPEGSKGSSLMQSGGGSLLPMLSTQGTADLALKEGLVDEFAAMEDEFDDGYVQTRTVVSADSDITAASLYSAPIFEHIINPLLYVETLLVIAVFALITRSLKWACSKIAAVSQPQAPKPLPQANAVCVEAREPAGKKGFALLDDAVRSGDESACLEALKQGGRWAVRQEDPYGCTALHVAAHCGSVAMVRLLLKHGAKIDACEAWDETPLHFAARSGSAEVCRILLAHRAEIDAENAYGWTPLLAAGHASQQAACEVLLSHGAGAGGVCETDLPPLLNTLLVRRMCSEAVHPVQEISAECFEREEVLEDCNE